MRENLRLLRFGAVALGLAVGISCSSSNSGDGGASPGGVGGSSASSGGTSADQGGAPGQGGPVGGSAGFSGGAGAGAGASSGDSGAGASGDSGAAGMGEGGGNTGGSSGAAGHAGVGGSAGSSGAGIGGSAGVGGSGGSTSAPPLSVVSTLPLASTSDNAPDVAIGAQLSAALNAATAGAGFSVKAGGVAVAGTASASGQALSFTPSRALEPNTTYTATISTTLASVAGGHLPAPFTWSFTTRRYALATPIDLASDLQGQSPQIAIDPKGNAVVAWLQYDTASYTVWANLFDAATLSWGTAKRLDSVAGTAGTETRVAMDKNGNAFVVWSLPSTASAPNSIWGARYTATGGAWGTATLLETDDTGEALSPLVAVDGAGNAIALWNQKNGGTGLYQLWSNRYTVGTGWGVRAQVETPHVGNGSQFDLGVDTAGNALAVWTMNAGAGLLVYSSRSVAGSAWTTPAVVGDGTAGVVTPHIAVDSAGNAVAIWAQPGTGNYREWGARYLLGSGWQAATSIQSTALPTAGSSQISSDANGNAIALWTQSSATVGGIWGNANLKPGNTWQGALNLSWAFNQPSLAISLNGHAAIASMASARIQANLGPVDATAGSGWGPALNVQAQLMNADSPDIVVNDSGVGLVTWMQIDAASHWRIWANRLR